MFGEHDHEARRRIDNLGHAGVIGDACFVPKTNAELSKPLDGIRDHAAANRPKPCRNVDGGSYPLARQVPR